MAEKLLPLLPAPWHQDINYYTENEFANKCRVDGQMQIFATEEELTAALEKHEGHVSKVVDGSILKGCDHLAAFVEAYLSVEHGITSKHLQNGIEELSASYKGRTIGGVDFGKIYEEFMAAEK